MPENDSTKCKYIKTKAPLRGIWGGLLFTLLIFLSCSSTDKYAHIRWEGIEGTTLRVYSRFVLTEEPDREDYEKKIPVILYNKASKRCTFLLYNYLLTKNIDNRDMTPLVKSGCRLKKKAFSECNEEFCYGYYDFDISVLLKSLDKENRL